MRHRETGDRLIDETLELILKTEVEMQQGRSSVSNQEGWQP